jgi:methionyl-tRNA formyltransferase
MISYKILVIGKKNDIFSKKFFRILRTSFLRTSVIYNNIRNHINIENKLKYSNFDYVICFRSDYIFKDAEIKKIKKYIINFHPGPPEYRGIGCVNFCILNKEKKYGSTVHIIDSHKIDCGRILHVSRWDILGNYNVDEILKKTYFKSLQQLRIIINYIKKDKISILLKKFKNQNWSKKLYTRKDLNKLYIIKTPIKKKYLDKLLKATNTKKYKPYILLHKKKFFYHE